MFLCVLLENISLHTVNDVRIRYSDIMVYQFHSTLCTIKWKTKKYHTVVYYQRVVRAWFSVLWSWIYNEGNKKYHTVVYYQGVVRAGYSVLWSWIYNGICDLGKILDKLGRESMQSIFLLKIIRNFEGFCIFSPV